MANGFQEFLNNPLVMLGANMMRAADPRMEGLGGLGAGLSATGETMRQRAQLAEEQERMRMLADLRMREYETGLAQQQREQERLQAYAAQNPQLSAQILAGQMPTDFQRKMQIAGGDPARYREMFGPGAGAQVDINLPGKEFGKEVGTQIAKDLIQERLPAARQAAQGLKNINEGRRLLDAGAFTGKFGPAQQAFGQALKDVGIDYGGDAVANTEAYMAAMGREVGSLIQMFGAGTGLSDADREFARQMAGGDIAVSEEGLRKILDINERARRNSLEQYNRDAEQVMSSPYGTSLPYNIMVPVPEAYKKQEEIKMPEPEETGQTGWRITGVSD